MHEDFRSTKRQMRGDLDEAISTSPLEYLERRVVALEQKVRCDPLANRNQSPPSTKQ